MNENSVCYSSFKVLYNRETISTISFYSKNLSLPLNICLNLILCSKYSLKLLPLLPLLFSIIHKKVNEHTTIHRTNNLLINGENSMRMYFMIKKRLDNNQPIQSTQSKLLLFIFIINLYSTNFCAIL